VRYERDACASVVYVLLKVQEGGRLEKREGEEERYQGSSAVGVLQNRGEGRWGWDGEEREGDAGDYGNVACGFVLCHRLLATLLWADFLKFVFSLMSPAC
jgi:hypothetical protein